MIKELENQIRDLQKELAEIKKNQSVLRLQPCLGDLEIREKDEKFDELDRRAKVVNDTIRGMTRKHQLLLSVSAPRTTYNSPGSNRGKKGGHCYNLLLLARASIDRIFGARR